MLNFIRRIRERWTLFLYRRQLGKLLTATQHYIGIEPGKRDTLEMDRELKKLNAMRHKMERGN